MVDNQSEEVYLMSSVIASRFFIYGVVSYKDRNYPITLRAASVQYGLALWSFRKRSTKSVEPVSWKSLAVQQPQDYAGRVEVRCVVGDVMYSMSKGETTGFEYNPSMEPDDANEKKPPRVSAPSDSIIIGKATVGTFVTSDQGRGFGFVYLPFRMVTINTVVKCLSVWMTQTHIPETQGDLVSFGSFQCVWATEPAHSLIQLTVVPEAGPEYGCGLRVGDLIRAITTSGGRLQVNVDGLCHLGDERLIPMEAILVMAPMDSEIMYEVSRLGVEMEDHTFSYRVAPAPEGYANLVFFPEYRIIGGVVFTYMTRAIQLRGNVYYNERGRWPLVAVKVLAESEAEVTTPSMVLKVIKKSGQHIEPRSLEDLDDCRVVKTDFGMVVI